MTSGGGRCLPPLTHMGTEMELRRVTDLASADRAEANAGAWISSVTDTDEALEMFTQVRAAARAVAELKKHGADRVRRWNILLLKAERRYGQLLGPSPGAGRPAGGNVSSGDNISHADRIIRSKARQVAAVDGDVFREYVFGKTSPTRAGLLRLTEEPAAPKAAAAPKEDEEKEMPQAETLRAHAEMDARMRRLLKQGKKTQDEWAAIMGTTRAEVRYSLSRIEGEDRAGGARKPGNWNGKSNAKRQRELREVKRAVPKNLLSLAQFAAEVNKMCVVLQDYDLTEYDLAGVADTALLDAAGIYDDLITLGEWYDRALMSVQAWVAGNATREKIAKLRNTTGRTDEETATAHRLADRLEKRLESRLIA